MLLFPDARIQRFYLFRNHMVSAPFIPPYFLLRGVILEEVYLTVVR